MWNSFIGGMTGAMAGLIDLIISFVQSMFTFNLSFFTENFPIITSLYTVIQGIGIGLAIAIAIVQLMKYFWGPLADVKTTPLEIAVRLLISIALIWVGNYILEGIINLFSYPYVKLSNIDTMSGAAANSSSSFSSAVDLITGIAYTGPGLVLLLLAFIATMVVGWNTCKLMLEVVERFLMIGVLTYTSPMAWATISSRNTHSIFQKWFSMFMGQCLLMLLNVWSVKMLLSILHYGSANILVRFIAALAFCKIAQRFDSYLQTFGINAAHTGGSLLEDLAAVAAGTTAIFSKAGSGMLKGMGNKALGETLGKQGLFGVAGYMAGSNMSNGAISRTARASGLSESAVRQAKEAGIADVPKFVKDNGVVGNADGTFSMKDKYGNIHTGKNIADLAQKANGINSSYAKYVGESGIHKDDNGMYHWTSATGKQYQSKNISDIYGAQNMERGQYSSDAELYTPITQNEDGKYTWTDKDGKTWVSDNYADAETTRATVMNGYKNQGNSVSPNSNLKDMANSQASGTVNAGENPYTPIVKNDDGKYEWTDASGQKYVSNSYEDARSNRESVVSGYSSQSVTPNASLKSTEGMLSQQSAMATYKELYSNDAGKRAMETVSPGITSAMAGDTSAGTISNLKYENGEMTGVYTSVDENGQIDMAQSFSVMNESSYNQLSESQKGEYTEFIGSDGNKYYFDAQEASISNDGGISGGYEVIEHSSDVAPSSGTDVANPDISGQSIPNSNSSQAPVETTKGEQFYSGAASAEVSGNVHTSHTSSDSKITSEQEKTSIHKFNTSKTENTGSKEKFIQNNRSAGIEQSNPIGRSQQNGKSKKHKK